MFPKLLLIISSPVVDPVHVVRAALACGRSFQTLIYWDQISDLMVSSSGDHRLEVDRTVITGSCKFIFLDYPAQASPPGSAPEAFVQAEWQAALTSLLFSRPDDVANGSRLIEAVGVRDAAPWLSRICSACDWNFNLSGRPKAARTIWALCQGGRLTTYPSRHYSVSLHVAFRGLTANLEAIRAAHRLDFIVLEIGIELDRTYIQHAWLAPLAHLPHDLLVDLVRQL